MTDRPFVPTPYSYIPQPASTVGQLYRPTCFLRIIRAASSYEKPVECRVQTKWLMCVCCGRVQDYLLYCDLMIIDRSANIILGADELSYKYRIQMHVCNGCITKGIEFTMDEFMRLPGVVLDASR